MPPLTSEQFQHYLASIRGSFAIEGIELSDDTIHNLQRIANGEATSDEIIHEILQRYSHESSSTHS
jgi:hypothetical protein